MTSLPDTALLPPPVTFSAQALHAFRRLATETAGLRDPALVAERALGIVMETGQADAGEIFLLDETDGYLHQQYVNAPPAARAAFGERTTFAIGEGYAGMAIQERAPIVSYNLRTDPYLVRRAVVRVGYRRLVMLPLLVQDRAVGAMGLFYKGSAPHDTPPFDLDLLTDLARQIAATLDAAHLYQPFSAQASQSDTTRVLHMLAAQEESNPDRRIHLLREITHEMTQLRVNDAARERQMHEIALESRKLRTLINSMPEGFLFADKDGRVVEINEIGRAILAMRTSFIGENIIADNPEFVDSTGVPIPADDLPITWAIRRGVLTRAREIVQRREGQPDTHLLVSAVPVKNDDGQIEGAVSVFQDVTQLKEIQHGLERALQAAEGGRRTLRGIIDNIPDGFIYIEADGRVVEVNAVARTMLSVRGDVPTLDALRACYTIHELTGTPIPPDDAPLTHALRGETILAREFIARRADGSEVNVISSTAPIRGVSGNIEGAVSIMQDVTRLKEMERIKSRFLSMVTHELRTPLAAIKGLVSGLLEDDVEWDTATEREFLESIEGEVDNLTALINNLLDMARLEAGYMRPALEECAIAEIANEMGRKLLPLAARNSQHIVIADTLHDLPTVLADYNQIERVLVNLVANAIKYAPDASTIDVLSAFDADADEVEVQVADRGPGIPDSERDHIFDAFFRGKQMAGRAGRKVGTGLGLAICRDIVAMHGGRIWYEDRPGGGALFVLRLPRIAIVT